MRSTARHQSKSQIAGMPAAVQWVADAFAHCKVMGVVRAVRPLLDKANVEEDAGVIELDGKGVDALIATAKKGRIWERELAAAPPAPPPARKKKR